MSFLAAEWRKLAIANYEINPELLKEYVPKGTELDLWNGKCFVSLLGFMFLNTKLLGVKIPFHINFEEVNFRFYVKRFENNEWRRGVVFIKEIVSKPAITMIANRLYKENYETMPMVHHWNKKGEEISIGYAWKKSSSWHQIEIAANKKAKPIEKNSEIEFITEHYWGYAKIDENSTYEYEVRHPRWNYYDVESYEVDIDFGIVYHPKFNMLTNTTPTSVMLVEGSEITVENKRKINL